MTDATHFPAPTQTLRGRLERAATALMKLAAFDRTRQDLYRLSQTTDADLAARGTTRDAVLRTIVSGRGMF